MLDVFLSPNHTFLFFPLFFSAPDKSVISFQLITGLEPCHESNLFISICKAFPQKWKHIYEALNIVMIFNLFSFSRNTDLKWFWEHGFMINSWSWDMTVCFLVDGWLHCVSQLHTFHGISLLKKVELWHANESFRHDFGIVAWLC